MSKVTQKAASALRNLRLSPAALLLATFLTLVLISTGLQALAQ